MSDTPRTDAAVVSAEYILREMDYYKHKFVIADHMRDLERELTAQKEQFRCVRWQLLLCRQMGIPYLTSCFVCAGERQIMNANKDKALEISKKFPFDPFPTADLAAALMEPKPWVGLTDEEITEIRLKMFDVVATNYEAYRAIEAKLKEKNT